MDGILSVDIVEGSFNKVSFARFVDGLLGQMNQFPGPNSVIVMDNCRIHKSETILEMIRERYVCLVLHVASAKANFCFFPPFHRGMRYEFLPPYSPDYNPIELAFSAIKAHIRRQGGLIRLAMDDDDDTDVYVKLNEAVWSVTVEDAVGWFHHCQYV